MPVGNTREHIACLLLLEPLLPAPPDKAYLLRSIVSAPLQLSESCIGFDETPWLGEKGLQPLIHALCRRQEDKT